MSQTVQTAEKLGSPIDCAHIVATMEEELLFQKGKSKTPLIGIDLLGGDQNHLEYILETLHKLFREVKDPFCLVVFTTAENHEHIKNCKDFSKDRLFCYQVEEVIQMDDDPLLAVRRKKSSSLCHGMRLLKDKKINALVTTGNTGALIASAKLHLPMLDGISRAALLTLLPTKKHPLAVIDVGANIECTPEHLVQFGLMAYAYQKSRGIAHPRMGLLNIGSEEKKGRAEFRETYKLLQELNQSNADGEPLFIGNVEGKEIFSGNVDVLITDGFTGNVFLKTAEGISSFILETFQKNKSFLAFSNPLLSRLEYELSSAEYPGAILCGVDGVIIKCHGDAKPKALVSGVKGALQLIHGEFIGKMKEQLKG